MTRLFAPILTVVAATAATAAPGHSAAVPLVGTVGPGLDITLTRASKPVTQLRPGSYSLVVRDRSRMHDFHLIGPGVNLVVTRVGFTGTKTLRLTLKPGRYRYVCDPHAFVMHGSFRVR